MIRDFVTYTVDSLDIAKEDDNVAAMVYAEHSQLEFHLNQHFKKDDIKEAIKNFSSFTGVSSICKALIYWPVYYKSFPFI